MVTVYGGEPLYIFIVAISKLLNPNGKKASLAPKTFPFLQRDEGSSNPGLERCYRNWTDLDDLQWCIITDTQETLQAELTSVRSYFNPIR